MQHEDSRAYLIEQLDHNSHFRTFVEARCILSSLVLNYSSSNTVVRGRSPLLWVQASRPPHPAAPAHVQACHTRGSHKVNFDHFHQGIRFSWPPSSSSCLTATTSVCSVFVHFLFRFMISFADSGLHDLVSTDAGSPQQRGQRNRELSPACCAASTSDLATVLQQGVHSGEMQGLTGAQATHRPSQQLLPQVCTRGAAHAHWHKWQQD